MINGVMVDGPDGFEELERRKAKRKWIQASWAQVKSI
jgi:hypothetical protein